MTRSRSRGRGAGHPSGSRGRGFAGCIHQGGATSRSEWSHGGVSFPGCSCRTTARRSGHRYHPVHVGQRLVDAGVQLGILLAQADAVVLGAERCPRFPIRPASWRCSSGPPPRPAPPRRRGRRSGPSGGDVVAVLLQVLEALGGGLVLVMASTALLPSCTPISLPAMSALVLMDESPLTTMIWWFPCRAR